MGLIEDSRAEKFQYRVAYAYSNGKVGELLDRFVTEAAAWRSANAIKVVWTVQPPATWIVYREAYDARWHEAHGTSYKEVVNHEHFLESMQ